VLWKYELDDKKRRWTKVPYQVNGKNASSTDPDTWTDFPTACKVRVQRNPDGDLRFDGIGFVVSDSDPYCGVDLDYCLNDKGAPSEWAQDVITTLDSYTEITPSGTGLRVWISGRLPTDRGRRKDKDKEKQIEIYDRRRFFTVTGNVYKAQPIRSRQVPLMRIYRTAFGEPQPVPPAPDLNGAPAQDIEIDETLLGKIRTSATGEKFIMLFDNGTWEALYPSQSEADLALCELLRFWVWSLGGAPAIDAYFRASALYREKWDAPRGNTTYGWQTIAKVVGNGAFDFWGKDNRPNRPAAAQDGPNAARNRRKARARTKEKPPRGKPPTPKPPRAKPSAPRASSPDGFAEFDPTIIKEHQIAAPRLPLSVFGPRWSKWLKDAANGKVAPVDFTAMPLLAVAASLIGNARRVSPWPDRDDWIEPSVLWIARVGPPSSRKTPGAEPVHKIINRLQWEVYENYKQELIAWEGKRMRAMLARERWKRDQKIRLANARKQTSLPIRDDEPPSTNLDPPRPVEKSLITVDVTIEALGSLLEAQPKGILEQCEELSGWLGSFNRYNKGTGERSFWNKAYNGEYHNIRRQNMNGGSIHIKHLAISVEGSIQPDHLNILFDGIDDGMIARFLYAAPDTIPFAKPTGAVNQDPALRALRKLTELTMDGDTFKIIRFDQAGAERMAQWYGGTNTEREKGLSGKFLSWHGKFPGKVARLALVLTYLKWAIEPGQTPEPEFIPDMSVTDAIKLADEYFLRMGERVFGDSALSQTMKNAKAVALLISRGKFVERTGNIRTISARTIQRASVNQMKHKEQVQGAVDELISAGWLKKIERVPLSQVGQPRKDYEVNPLVFSL
jgi:hypothetical protein